MGQWEPAYPRTQIWQCHGGADRRKIVEQIRVCNFHAFGPGCGPRRILQEGEIRGQRPVPQRAELRSDDARRIYQELRWRAWEREPFQDGATADEQSRPAVLNDPDKQIRRPTGSRTVRRHRYRAGIEAGKYGDHEFWAGRKQDHHSVSRACVLPDLLCSCAGLKIELAIGQRGRFYPSLVKEEIDGLAWNGFHAVLKNFEERAQV
jgi:hypothetical protein